MANRGRNRVDQLRLQQRAGIEAAQRRLRTDGAGIAGQFLIAQEAACGPWQQRVEPEHHARQQQRAVGPVIAVATVVALVLQDQVLLLCGELLVECRADHDARSPQAHQRGQAGIAAGLPAAIGARRQWTHPPFETELCAQVAQQADARAQRPQREQQPCPWQRRPVQSIDGTGHHFQRQRGYLLQQRNLRQRQHQCHQQHRQQPPAAVGQPRAAHPHQQRSHYCQQDHAHRQPQAGLPQSVEQLSHGPAPGSASSVRRCPVRSTGHVR